MLWTHASVVVPRFTGSVLADIPVPCTFDFNVAATKYFHGVTQRRFAACVSNSAGTFSIRAKTERSKSPLFRGTKKRSIACR